MSADVNVEVFFCSLQIHWIVKIHALFILHLPVPPHYITSDCSHGQQHCRTEITTFQNMEKQSISLQ